jgi:hypothetical protein
VSIVVVVANVIVNVENVSNLQWFPSNLHIHPLQSADVLHPLENLYHVPSSLHGFAPLDVLLVAMSLVVSLASAPLVVSLVEMSFHVLLKFI